MSSSSNTIEVISITNNPTTLLHINMSNVSKLTSTNYLMWSLQVHALLDGYALAKHLNANDVVPSQTITTDDVAIANPEFVHWTRQDKLIYSALLGAITTSIQPTVSRTTTASQIWKKLAATYAKPSRGHIKQLRDQLKIYTKGTKTIDEYLQCAMSILGKPYDHEDQVELILAGLPDDYKTVVDQIEGKDTAPSITEVHERLLNHEAKLLSSGSTPSSVIPTSANAAQHRSQQTYNNNRNKYNNRKNNTSPTPMITCPTCKQTIDQIRGLSNRTLGSVSYATLKVTVHDDAHNFKDCNTMRAHQISIHSNHGNRGQMLQ